MKVSIRTKLQVAIGLLAGFMIILWISGSVFINTLARNSGAIIQDNIRSVTYARQMEATLNELYTGYITAVDDTLSSGLTDTSLPGTPARRLDSLLAVQAQNITETGEQELTDSLTTHYREFITAIQTAGQSPSPGLEAVNELVTPAYRRLQEELNRLARMNVAAIERKNDTAQRTASNVTLYMSVIGFLCSVLGIVMLFRFPGYLVDPIQELIKRIQQIADRNYDQSLSFHTGDEYEELARAFNRMADKLQEYENSSLDRILNEKKRVETIINYMSDAVIGLDAEGRVLFLNDRTLNLINGRKEDVVNRRVGDLASSSPLFENIYLALSQGEQEHSYLKIDESSEHYYSIESIPVPRESEEDEQWKPHLGYIVTLKNVTRYHEMDQAKTNFISVVSHELKTPISSISMSLRLLEDKRTGSLNEEHRQMVSNIRKDVGRMKRTISDLLDLSRIETGNIQMNTSKVSPGDLLEYAFETMYMQAEQKKLHLAIKQTGEQPPVQADPQKTVWVLVNLISNAIRYTPSGGSISLSAVEADNSGYVRFSVEDDGAGIPEDSVDHIFEKYYRVEDQKSSDPGTGLGLAIAKDFIVAQGGEIWVDSQLHQGSRFSFTLPVAES